MNLKAQFALCRSRLSNPGELDMVFGDGWEAIEFHIEIPTMPPLGYQVSLGGLDDAFIECVKWHPLENLVWIYLGFQQEDEAYIDVAAAHRILKAGWIVTPI